MQGSLLEVRSTVPWSDLGAGLVVFLVALPLCLGIALASGAPLFAGVIGGIIGGTVVGLLSGSHVSVSGPAAGLVVIVSGAIQSIGTFPAFLTAVILSGAIQVVFSVVRAGIIGDFVPNAVIKGMLAGIGIVIILKQIPHALGRDQDFEGDLAFLESAGNNTLTEILIAFATSNTGAVLIALVSLAILIGWDNALVPRFRIARIVPAPLGAVLAGIGLNELFGVVVPSLHLREAEHLVRLPEVASAEQFFRQFMLPDFSAISQKATWIAAGTIAIVGSIETLLALEAADKIDPYRRISPPNRELFAQGIGNMASGFLGGLPITSVVVRTSANVYAGAVTRWSSVTHGVLLLLAALLIPGLLNRTPLASLAAVLIVIGYRLARIDLFRQMRAAGWGQFLPFMLTVLAVVFSDLLIGVVAGMALGLAFVLHANHHKAISVVSQDSHYLMRFNKDITFVHKSILKRTLSRIPDGATLYIDATKALYVDKDAYETIEEFREEARYRHITVELKNFQKFAAPTDPKLIPSH